jgi:DNA-binding CsgD family transcriptional regulator
MDGGANAVSEAVEIVGRDAEVAAITRFVADEETSALLLEGEAGIGKSTLWDYGARLAGERGARVLRSRPTEAEVQLSFSGLTDLLDPVLDEVLPVLAEPRARALKAALLRDDVRSADPRAIGLGVVDALDVLSEESPMLVAIDDWQWLDSATASLLSYAARRSSAGSVRFMFALRQSGETQHAEMLARELEPPPVSRVPVPPLTLSDFHLLLSRRLGIALSRPALTRLHRDTRGNPFLALEVARAVRSAGADLSSVESLPVPTDLQALLRLRVEALDNHANAVLRVAALLGDPSVPLIDRALDTGASVTAGIESAAAAGVLTVEGDRVRFEHPLFASAVTATMTAATKRKLHAAIARASDDVEHRARHLALSADGPAERIAATLEQAAEHASARGARAVAAELLDLAAKLTPDEQADRRVNRALAGARHDHIAGDGQRAARIARSLIDSLPAGRDRAAALETLANVATSGPVESYYRQALAEAGDDARFCGAIRYELGMALSVVGDRDEATEEIRAGIALLEEAGDHGMAARALAELGLQLWSKGDGLQRELFERARQEEALADFAPATGRTPEYSFGRQLLGDGELAAARPLIEHSHQAALQAGDVELEEDALALLVRLELLAGNWAAADRYASEVLELAEQVHISNSHPVCLAHRALVDAHLGALDSARAHAEEGAEQARRFRDRVWELKNHWALGLAALGRGDSADAVRVLAPLRDLIADERGNPELFPARALLIEALVLAGELSDAREVLGAFESAPGSGENRWGIAMAKQCRALLLAAEGDLDVALACCGEAVEIHEQLAMPFELGRCLLNFGVIQRRAKAKRPARETLEKAGAIFESLGASLWAERTLAEARRIGGRRTPSDGALTATEQLVAELAAAGRANKQIAAELHVSERTVEANLTKVYRKLGIHSRTQIATRLSPSPR